MTDLSKFLSFVLRHEPAAIGIELDRNGWVEIDCLVAQCRAHGKAVSRELIEAVVATNSKRRFAISDDGRRIRASQGHSVSVELGDEPAEPPELLFHGTVRGSLPSIRAEGLLKRSRHHVHLSRDAGTACTVGARRGRPVVLRIAAGRMHRDGHEFLPLRSVGQKVVRPPSHRRAKRHSLRPADLAGEPLVVAPAGRPHRVMLQQLLRASGCELQVGVEATGWELMLQFARYGIGITVVNDFCPTPKAMAAVPLEGSPRTTYYLVERSGFTSEGAAWLIIETFRSG